MRCEIMRHSSSVYLIYFSNLKALNNNLFSTLLVKTYLNILVFEAKYDL